MLPKIPCRSNINGVSATLTNNYYTSAKTDQAISAAKNTLQSNINGVSANLANNYYTSAKTDQAISAAKNTLQSNINGVSANLANNYYTSAKDRSGDQCCQKYPAVEYQRRECHADQ